MRISTSSIELLKSLQTLAKAIPSRSTLPILNCVMIEVQDNNISLKTTDLEITIISKINASIEESGAAAIPLQTILDITNELPDTRMTITTDDEYHIKISTDDGAYDLMGKPVKEFPTTPEVNNRKTTGIDTKGLKEIIKLTSFAISKDDLKPALTGVLFRFETDRLIAVSTDGHKLVHYVRSDFKSAEFAGDVVVPRKFLNLMNSLLPAQESIQLWMGDNNLMAIAGDDIVFTRIIDERFPDFESVIPVDNDKELLIKREVLLGAVRRVSIFSNRSTHQIALDIKKDIVKVRTEDPEKSSKGVEKISATFEGDEIIIGYNANYLKEVLMHLDTKNVIFKVKTPISAGLIYPDVQKNGRKITMLLMPIRLND